MITLRDTLAATLLGIRMPSGGEEEVKKKKKPKKRKSKPLKVQAIEEEVKGQSEDEGEEEEEEEGSVDGSAKVKQGQKEDSGGREGMATALYHFESTQLADPIQAMVRRLGVETGLGAAAVGLQVTAMFEGGRRYDHVDSVLAELGVGVGGQGMGQEEGQGGQEEGGQGVWGQGQSRWTTLGAAVSVEVQDGGEVGMGGVVGDSETKSSKSHTETHSHASHTHTHTDTHTLSSQQQQQQLELEQQNNNQQPEQQEQQQELSVSARLDMVAAYASTDAYEALSALCSWAAVSALVENEGDQQTQWMSLLREERVQKACVFFSSALAVLLGALLSAPPLQDASKGALLALLQHLLLPSAAEEAGGAGGGEGEEEGVRVLSETLVLLVEQGQA
ncbi:hypothetical protein B484DRAFT_418010, partial [Ochromonadaceae sp. CCMP2298]